MTSLDDIWRHFAGRMGILDSRPDFRLDPVHYANKYQDVTRESAAEHFRDHGVEQKRHGNFYSGLKAQAEHIDKPLAQLIIHPELKALIEADAPQALELACELIQLGSPIDTEISDFSMEGYLEWYPDIRAGNMDPLMHYLRFGAKEGWRKTLADLRKATHMGEMPFRPGLPTVLICVHEMSRSGAPIVGRDLVREASRTHNVAVAAMRGGELLEQFLPHCCAVLTTTNLLRELPFVASESFRRIDFAILNSVECAPFIQPLVGKGIPFAAYLHEYSDYTHPGVAKAMASFADLLVYSSESVRESWHGRLTDLTVDIARDSTIIPQHPLLIGQVTEARRVEARKNLSAVLKRDLSNVRLICGAGHVQLRKGTDIFVQAAQIAAKRDPDTVFLWIGDGQNHQDIYFGVWFDYHLRQVGVNRPEGNLFFLPAGPLYMDVMAASDAMFLSSRLDPLPNVVFDAARQGCRVVCFEGATGFADACYQDTDLITRVGYADPEAAVEALQALPRKTGTDDTVAPGAEQEPFLFDRIREALQDRLARQRDFVLGETAIDLPVLFSKSETDRPFRQREREKLFTYKRRLMWRDIEDARKTIAASDNWVHRRLQLDEYRNIPRTDADIPDFAVHIHAFYIDDLPDDLRNHAAFARARRILATTDTETKARQIRDIGARHGLTIETLLVPNRGRDILPFLQLFGRDNAAGEDRIWCHLHQKKSAQTTSSGDVWRQFLHRILLGDQDRLSSAILRIADQGVGVVAPFEPHFIPWDDSRRLLLKIADRFPGPMPENPLLFPVGNMFWTRADVARRMLDLFGEDYPWPNEPIPTDGTEFHLIERLWPAVAAQMGLDAVFVHKMDEERV